MVPISEFPIRTFEEALLTEEEREARRIEKEKDRELAAYYRSILDDPESFLVIRENADDEIPEDDHFIWDDDPEARLL